MMLRKKRDKQQQMQVVILEQMIPEDHLLRLIDRYVDFSFIRKLCAPLYSENNGRPAIDPEVLFRMLFVGYLYGVKSERRLEEEINYNIAYKWFCGLELTDKSPDATTISANRRRRFRDNNIAEQIFDEILCQAQAAGLVGGAIVYTDSTHIKAKANKHRKKLVEVAQTPKHYLAELDEQIDRDRQVLGKKPFDRDDDDPPKTTTRMQSTTDPDSGQLSKEGKPDGFHYSEHRTVDSKYNIIVDCHITPANINDVTPLPQILKSVTRRLGKAPKYMGLDAGYHTAPVAWLLQQWGIQAVLGYRRHTHKTPYFGKHRFYYDFDQDVYWCPGKQPLYWKTTNREGYREYYSNAKLCRDCPKRKECISEKATRRQVTRHVWQDWLDKATAFAKTPNGRRLYHWRKETIEPSFAESKDNHGLRTARMVGLAGMREQSFLTAAVQNMKKIARFFFCFLLCNPAGSFYAQRGCLSNTKKKTSEGGCQRSLFVVR